MDNKKPAEVVELMIQSGSDKMKLTPVDLMIRGILSGTILGCGTTLAITATTQTGLAIVGAAIFPACFIIIVLMGFELVTGSFAILPTAFMDKRISFNGMLKNISIVFTGNLVGGVLYAMLFWISITNFGQAHSSPLVAAVIKLAETKTLGYAQYGSAGLLTAITKGVLCNWLVTMGVVMSLTSSSTQGKIMAAWLPIFIFFAQGFEHAVVNMFLIPAGMLLGANISVADWWLFNQLPVTLGNIIGGVLFTALALYATHKYKKEKAPMPAAVDDNALLEPLQFREV